MNGNHPIVALDVALAHQDEALRHAAVDRLTRIARGERSSTTSHLRRLCGNALVRIGQSLQGTRPRRQTGDLAATAAVLHIAR